MWIGFPGSKSIYLWLETEFLLLKYFSHVFSLRQTFAAKYFAEHFPWTCTQRAIISCVFLLKLWLLWQMQELNSCDVLWAVETSFAFELQTQESIDVHLQSTKGWHLLNRIGAEPLQSHPHFFQLGWLLIGKWTSKSCTDALRSVQTYKNTVPHHGNLISCSSSSFSNVEKYYRTVKSKELDGERRQNWMVLLRTQLFKWLSHLLLRLLCVTCTLWKWRKKPMDIYRHLLRSSYDGWEQEVEKKAG